MFFFHYFSLFYGLFSFNFETDLFKMRFKIVWFLTLLLMFYFERFSNNLIFVLTQIIASTKTNYINLFLFK
jgi:hypothetical protein